MRARVFVLFALGYFVSYLYRGVNIGFAPFITRDVGLGAGDLGLLTSLYFLGFAAAQIPPASCSIAMARAAPTPRCSSWRLSVSRSSAAPAVCRR